ncbi:MAG: tryptophan synthase subunit alpha [Atopobium sp.]|uniref:tryptophan synthase subunit alpha n=1 Tax=Atopobium sp. TaxID=1872650 RepID=UPI002A7513A8|nr:tryptophan synthase subunit alpha [Atopobium sp.]MDY2787994.1 tryptophan synthase subunit alpha [Atopobium sp.]MDY4523351.1 tryptophan synthase subunit alpha [Atopobium sp.]
MGDRGLSKHNEKTTLSLRANNIVLFLTFGYPDWNTFFELLRLFDAYGIGYVELGIPVQHPFADGEVIKEASAHVLSTLTKSEIIEKLKEIRSYFSFKVILMTYKEGVDTFDLSSIDPTLFDALLCVDECYSESVFPNIIQLFSKDLSNQQMKKYAERTSQFAYVLSGSGKTGSQGALQTEYIDVIGHLNRITDKKKYVGFGIRTRDDALSVLQNGADGIIVGSELMRRINDGGVAAAETYLQELGLIKQ